MTVFPWHPNGCTFIARNFHIKAWVSEPWSLTSDGWMSSARLTLSRTASGWEHYIVQTVPTVFPYLCIGKKTFYLSNTKRRSDVLLRHPDRCNREQFDASGRRGMSRQNTFHCLDGWCFDRWVSRQNTTSSRRMQGNWTTLFWILDRVFLKLITEV